MLRPSLALGGTELYLLINRHCIGYERLRLQYCLDLSGLESSNIAKKETHLTNCRTYCKAVVG